MHRCLFILVLLLAPPCAAFAQEPPQLRDGIITRITGNEVVLLLNDAGSLRVGDKIAITSAPSAAKNVEARTDSPITRLAPTFPGKVVGLVIADLDADGKMEIVVALEERIIVGRLSGKDWSTLIDKPLGGALTALGLDSFDLNGDQRPELFLTAARGAALASQIFTFDGKELQVLAANLPWFLRVLDLPGADSTLLGQRQGEDFYAGTPFQVKWEKGQILAGADIPLPAAVMLHGSQIFTYEDKYLWLALNAGDDLTVIDATGEKLWQGDEKFGGKESYLEWSPRGARGEVQRRYLRSAPRRNGNLIILPQNEGSRSLSNWRKAEKNRLVALRWNGYQVEKVWESPTRDGYLADFAYGDVDNDGSAEYLLAGTLATGFFTKSTTALFLWKGPEKP
jgi:hypothetical protein